MKRLVSLVLVFQLSLSYAQTYVHIVTDRDNIYKLAKIYDLTPKQIADINQLDSITQKLLIYQKLIIPEKNYITGSKTGVYVKKISHPIQKNETLFTIAKHYNVTVFDILLNNPTIERGKPLPEGDELKIMVNASTRSKFSQQIIYLNGDVYKMDSLRSLKKVDLAAVERLNQNIDQKIIELTSLAPNVKLLDSFTLPSSDTSSMSRWIYHLVKYSIDSSMNKDLWLDSLYNEIFYVRSEIKTREMVSEHQFLINVFQNLHLLTENFPTNDYIHSLRGALYYWLKNKYKAEIYADEALSINPQNASARLVKASILLDNDYLEQAQLSFKYLHQVYSNNCITFNLASTYYYKQDFNTALEIYSKLLPVAKDMKPELDFRIGQCYILINDDDNGCEYMKEALRADYPKAFPVWNRHCK